MKNKKIKFLINLIIICLCVLMLFTTNSHATNDTIDNWIQEGNDFINNGSKESPITTSDLANTVIPIRSSIGSYRNSSFGYSNYYYGNKIYGM